MRTPGGVLFPLLVATVFGIGALAQSYIRQTCAPDDFRCYNGMCIESSKRCNRVYDCSEHEDEIGCDCAPDEFLCQSNGRCIEARKRCDGVQHCPDGSDELDCATGYFKCKSGKLIPEHLRCNRQYDCPPDDLSDEQNCPCRPGDFKCDNGHCIPESKHCDRTHNCQDGSDERYCTYGSLCMAYQFECKSGMCVPAEARCNGIVDCDDRSDEESCNCKRGQHTCRDGSCINIAYFCNGHEDCAGGEDEYNCKPSCPPGQFTCQDGSNTCAVKCNGEAECYGGEDEADCDDVGDEDFGDCPQDAHPCDNKCLPGSQICDGRQDCSDNSDETGCDTCVGPDDFRCTSGDCLPFSLRCNGIKECPDGSDEYNCHQIMVPANEQCSPDQFQCRSDLLCIDMHFFCDGNDDCLDKSDESNCQCPSDSYPCRDGQCIPSSNYCDGNRDCRDGSDESECSWSTTQRTYVLPTTSRTPPTTVNYPLYTTTARPDLYPSRGDSGRYPSRWPQQPESGDLDGGRRPSDPYGQGGTGGTGGTGGGRGQGPVALKLMTYPEIETVRDVGGDVVLQCRDEGLETRARVQWRKEGGSIKQGSTDVRGRLEMFKVGPDDSGTYICAAVNYAGYPGAEKRVTLNVVVSSATTTAPFRACLPHQATCASGQCIPKSSVCNSRKDCDDNSDEENCHHGGMCEPNEFKCNNRKCVLKSWLCDSENDCGDGSDEQDCGPKEPGQCSRNEFACHTNNQCVPRSFHCDKHPDCFDGTDELGCRGAYIKSPPKPSNLKLNAGDTLTLRCEALGVPMPIISWRLNWGHVPPQCTSTSVNGLGVLTCENMQPKDSGAYSCEAINNKEALFATPDAIVFVTKQDICPPGYFNSEARSESECIRCFCFDSSDQCHSADLFTFNMPTDFGVGGTRLVGVQASPSGEVTIDPQSITSQYFYQPLRNGATVTKFSDGPAWSDSYPYLTLPEAYNGNQLKSYGGHIRYTLAPQTQIFSFDNTAPTIIIKGKYGNLFHVNRAGGSRDISIEARFTPEGWSKYPDGSQPAKREDIMMVLVDIEMTLLRADLNNAGVNISNFVMESADHFNVGIGAASLVEECTCPTGYEGLSCQKCAQGFVRKKIGPWLGPCQPAAPEVCAAGTYGDPSSGIPCKACPCPLTNKGNQFASTCSLGPDGSVYCDCFPGYQGPRCSECAPGYEGNPMVPGNSCQPKPSDKCNPIGTKTIRPPDECVCKDQVQGRYCDSCKKDSFFLSEDYNEGCARCFCLGESQECVSSTYRRKAITAQFNVPQVVEQINVYSSAPAGPRSSIRYSVPTLTDLRPELVRGELVVNNLDRSSRAKVYYWSMPLSFAGDKVTSYGGFLRYSLKNVPIFVDPRYSNTAPSVQLISENQLTFHYVRDFNASYDGFLNGNAQFLENEWKRPDGKDVSRPELILALADVKAILIKATYAPGSSMATPTSASIEIAEPDAYGPIASHVEQCVCPPEYIGTSCEDCRPGFTRSSSGLYLEHCAPCQCNGKASTCDPETGKCHDCKDNTDGDFCDKCKPGYELDENGNCVDTRRQPVPCGCDPRGTSEPCDDAGNCYCKRNVEGSYCDRCRPGTFGLEVSNPDGCLSCYCSGVTSDCHEGDDYVRLPLGAPVLGDDFGGFTLTDLRAEKVIKDNFAPVFDQSELAYVKQFDPDVDLYWSVPKFPGNRVLSYGGTMSLRQKFAAEEGVLSERGTDVVFDGGDISIFWTNPHQMRSGESYTYQVPITEKDWYILNSATPVSRTDFMKVLRNLKRVLVRASLARNIYETSIGDVSMDTASQLSDDQLSVAKGIEICRCPEGYSGTSCEKCQQDYYKDQSGYCRKCPCNGYGCQLNSQGQVICNCRAPFTGPDCSVTGDPEATTRPQVPQPPPSEPTVTVTITSPILKIQEVGGRVSFICQAQSRNTRARLPVTWTKSDGFLPLERTELNEVIGELVITNVQVSDSGQYICETTDGITSAQAIATLNVPSNTMTGPTVEILPSKKDYYIGEHIQLECRTSGNPAPTINWLRGTGRPLPLSVVIRGNWLFIDEAQVEDTGEYRCIATNTVGSTFGTAMITVRSRNPNPPDKLVVSNTSPTINEGQSIRVVCTGTTNVPAGSLDWVRKDNTAFMTNVRSDNGVLYVEYAVPGNQGVYICHSSLSNVSPIQVLLSVVATNPSTDVYNITVTSDRLKIPTGGSGSVDCNSVSAVPVIRWSKYGSERLGPESSQRGNTLIINNAQNSDQGYYICEAINSAGDSVNTIYVFVEIERREPPRVEIWPTGEQAVQLGGQHELHCRILGGIPIPDVIWNRNGGRPLTSSTQILPRNILKFFKVDVNDEGTYTCTAHNDAGNANASAIVKVRSAPEITITPQQEITVYIGEPVKVECRAKGIPEPTVSISLENTPLIPSQPRLAALQISSASLQDAGYYTCTASSPAGSITEQFFVEVIDRGDGGSTDDFDAEGSGDDPGMPEPWPPQLPRNVYILEGKPEAVIYCNESGNVQWRRADNFPLQSNAHQINTKLIIVNASKSDSGQYVCDIYNIYNEIQHAVTTNLVVVAPLRIQLLPQKQTVQPGQSPTVECVVNGDGVTGVYWQPYNRQSSERMEIRANKLIFHEIEVEDAGQYECIARGTYTNASSIAEVIVSEYSDRPRVSHAHEQRAHAGSAVHLRCNATQRYARIAWTKDGSRVPGSVTLKSDGSLFIQLAHKSDSGRYVCLIKDDNGRTLTSSYIDLHIQGRQVTTKQQLVNIEQPRRVFRVGDNALIHCTTRNSRVRVQWIRLGTTEFVNSMPYGDGAVLSIQSVTFADSGVYRCVGKEGSGRESYVDLQLIVESGSGEPIYTMPGDRDIAEYTAHLRNQIDMPCVHDLEGPVTVEWRREFLPLPAGARSNQPTLHFESVTEADAGTYVCRISNSRVAMETRAVLTVKGVVPMFNGESYVALPRLKDAYNKFEIEISFKPQDENGLIFYNAETENGQDGDFIALELKEGIPTFTMKTSIIAVTIVKNDRPLTLNKWHTIRISRTDAKVTMDVDNTGPFFASSPKRLEILDLNQQLYIGGIPDHIQLPEELAGASGLIGCVSILILGKEEKSIMMDSVYQQAITECNSCNPNLCQNSGFCQEARNERGYVCICTNGFAGLNCDRTGEACQPGLCGPGKCSDTDNGYKCACPVTHTGRNCEINQTIGYPAFAGSAYLAIQQPKSFRSLKMSMNIKAAAPVTDGIIMYCAETRRGYGGFTALTVRNGKLEFRYDLGGETEPVVLVSNRTLPANQWTNVHISRIGAVVSMKVNKVHAYEQMLDASYQGSDLHFDTPVFVGGVDEDITLNKETGVTGGFSGCIKDFTMFEQAIDIVNKTIKSANVQECVAAVDDRGDIPEEAGDGCQCRNGGQCYPSGTDIFCVCPPGYTGQYCESRASSSMTRDRPENPCNVAPCRNGGTCKPDFNARMNHTCDCPLGYAGDYCQIPVELLQSVGFSGNGYLELPAAMIRYDNLDIEPALFAMAIHTTNDGVLLYQREVQSPYNGDYIQLRINRGIVEMEWNLGSGKTLISVREVYVIDGERHQIIGKLSSDGQGSLSVDGHQAIGTSPGISNVMAADSNIYIGGIPDHINQQGYSGFDGCIEQVELMSTGRSLQLGREAVAGRNTQRCKDPRF